VSDFADLPGGCVVERGLEDLRSGRTSIASLLVTTAATRLTALGLDAVGPTGRVADPELRLYAMLGESGIPDPYSRYNALKRKLASFIHALEHRIERGRRLGG
jgi:hypothetical protein